MSIHSSSGFSDLSICPAEDDIIDILHTDRSIENPPVAPSARIVHNAHIRSSSQDTLHNTGDIQSSSYLSRQDTLRADGVIQSTVGFLAHQDTLHADNDIQSTSGSSFVLSRRDTLCADNGIRFTLGSGFCLSRQNTLRADGDIQTTLHPGFSLSRQATIPAEDETPWSKIPGLPGRAGPIPPRNEPIIYIPREDIQHPRCSNPICDI